MVVLAFCPQDEILSRRVNRSLERSLLTSPRLFIALKMSCSGSGIHCWAPLKSMSILQSTGYNPSCQTDFGKRTNLILSISSKELHDNELSRLFARGARAVMVRDDDRINKFVKATLEWLGADEPDHASLQFPFGKNLCNLSGNHVAENGLLGDMLRFEPGRIVHTARKFIVYGSARDQSLRTFPDQFYASNQAAAVPYVIKDLAWALMSEIFASTCIGTHSVYSSYAVQVEILTYPGSRSDIEVLGNLLANSCGRWSRWGYLIDGYRNNAYGIFDVKIVRDFYALGSLLPGIAIALGFFNARIADGRTGVYRKVIFYSDAHMSMMANTLPRLQVAEPTCIRRF